MVAEGLSAKVIYQRQVAKGPYRFQFAILPYTANFNLALNVVKSQKGDVKDIDYSNTVNIAGTLSDDTEFSFNAVKK